MSEEEITLPDRGYGLLRSSRTRSYGSLVRSPVSPARQRRIEHRVQPGETLQGLALKYGVSVRADLYGCLCSPSLEDSLLIIMDPATMFPVFALEVVLG